MPAKLDRCVKNVKAQGLAKYAKSKGIKVSEIPDKAKKRIESSAWAICRKSTGL